MGENFKADPAKHYQAMAAFFLFNGTKGLEDWKIMVTIKQKSKELINFLDNSTFPRQ